MALEKPVTVLRRCLALLLLCSLFGFLTLGVPAMAASPQDTAPDRVATEPVIPGIEQLAPLSAILMVEAKEAGGLLDKWDNQAALSGQFEANQQTLLALDQNLASWGPLEQWSEGRLLGTKQRLAAIRDRLQNQVGQLTTLRGYHEELRSDWQKKLAFWEEWEKDLAKGRAKVPPTAFIQNRAVIHGLLARIDQAIAALDALQQQLLAQQTVATAWLAQVESAIGSLRGSLLERNAPPLLSAEFFGQFNTSLWVGLLDDLNNALRIPKDFHVRHGWIIILQLVATVLITWRIYRRARDPKPIHDQLRFLFRHPVAGGVFLALIAGGLLQASPPPFWQWLQRVLGALAATVLICAMLERPRLRRVIVTLAALYICAMTIRLVGLVQPLHRVFLVGVCLIAAPLCLAAARRQRQRNAGRLDLLGAAFYLGTLAATVGLAAQLGGFSNLTNWLVNGFLGTTFVYLFACMVLHLGRGGLAALLENEVIRSQRFIRRLGPQTGPRLTTLMHIIVISYAVLYLLVHWNIYQTPSEAWTGIIAASFKVGELQISLGIVLTAIFVLYLTFIVSWIIQALLDAGVMTPQGMEQGVKIAVKTLIHYSLILIGFLFAISVAGIDMSKFAILAGALGVGIGFGLQNIVNNFLSGLILLFERPVKVGDTVTLEDQWGTITRIGLRSTVVETADKSEVIVPNSELISQRVVNWTFSSNMSRVLLPIGVAYGTPLEKVLAILLQVADEHPQTLKHPESSAIFTGFGDSAINFELRVWIADINQRLQVRSELGLAIDRHFRAAGIVIPFPQRDLHLQSIPPTLQGLAPQPVCGVTTTAKEPDA